MSRATSAVDIEPDSGVPVVEHADPMFSDAGDVRRLLVVRDGEGDVRAGEVGGLLAHVLPAAHVVAVVGAAGVHADDVEPLEDLGAEELARGRRDLDPRAAGPPGLRNSEPTLVAWSVAGWRSTATAVVAPRGWS